MGGDHHERRKFGRRSVFKHAVVVQREGERIPGVVVDISEGGARFQTQDVSRLDKKLILEIPSDDFVVKCEVVHVLENSVGLKFVESPRRLSWGPKSELRLLKSILKKNSQQ